MDMLPGQADSEVAGLDAKLQSANQGIVDAARRRGLGFSGIPIAEQAKYAATDYAPAVARVRDNARSQAMSLQEALLGLSRDQRTQAEGIYNNEQARALQEAQLAEQQRQFNENLAFQREQAARQAAAASSGGYSFGGGSSFSGGAGGQGYSATDVLKAKATNAVGEMLKRRGDSSFFREMMAIDKSAGYGNQLDQAKLELLQAYQPGLFQNGKLNYNRISALLNSLGNR